MIQQMILGMQNRPSSVNHPPNRLEQWALAKNNRKKTFERTPIEIVKKHSLLPKLISDLLRSPPPYNLEVQRPNYWI
jgi:hypothetical protein